MICSYLSRINVRPTTSEEDIATSTVSTSLKIISNYRDRRLERMQTLSVCFHKIRKILIINTTITRVRTCLRMSLRNDHASTDMPKDEFKKLCKTAWEQHHGFLVIDQSSNKDNGKYRCGFHDFYIPMTI